MEVQKKVNKIGQLPLPSKNVNIFDAPTTEAAACGVSYKEVFLKNSQNSQENACEFAHMCFRVNLVKFLRASLLQNTSERLLLQLAHDRHLSDQYWS